MRKRCSMVVILILAVVTVGCAGKRLGPEQVRLAAGVIVNETHIQFRQAAAIFDAACDRHVSQLTPSELQECADWVKVVESYKVAYPAAVAALQATAGQSTPNALEALLAVKNEIIRLLVFRGVAPAKAS